MSLWTQYLTVFAMSASGAVLGAVYDVYRTILAEWKYLRFLGSILDFAFWIFALLLVLWSIHWANDGDVRLYVFLVMLIGFGLYRLLLRKIVVGSTVGVVKTITYLLKVLGRFLYLTMIVPLLWLWTLFLMLVRGIDRFAGVLERILLWPFGPLLGALEWTGRQLYRWTILPLVEPVLKPVQKFIERVKQKWRGILRSVANWLVDQEDEDDESKKR
jgi:spore cortex biosynthesis protein YabQ